MASEDPGGQAQAREGLATVTEARLINVEQAPDVYIEGYHGATIHNGVVKLNAYVTGFDPDTDQNFRRAVARLTMPIASLIQIHEAFGRLINQLESQGIVKRMEGGPDAGE